jgi:putative addiction module component (TIGR02574 family)
MLISSATGKLTTPLSGAYHLTMQTVQEIRKDAMSLSAIERASLAHDLILSLDDPHDYELSESQEVEIARRLQMVREGTAAGRPADNIFSAIRAKYQ